LLICILIADTSRLVSIGAMPSTNKILNFTYVSLVAVDDPAPGSSRSSLDTIACPVPQ
jgi:hypothetical protein